MTARSPSPKKKQKPVTERYMTFEEIRQGLDQVGFAMVTKEFEKDFHLLSKKFEIAMVALNQIGREQYHPPALDAANFFQKTAIDAHNAIVELKELPPTS